MNANRRPVPARVAAREELRRSGASGLHPDRRREISAKGCRGKHLARALREQAY